MSVAVKDCSTCSFKVSETVLNCTVKVTKAWILPVSSCCTPFIDDSRYLSGDEAAKIRLCTQPQKNEVSFVQISSPDNANELGNYWKISMKAIQNRNVGENFYINYDAEYSLFVVM